jgi:putative endonuclease
MYYVYLLECADGSIYTGVTTDVARRFKEHADGKGAQYTKARKATKLLYTEKAKDRSTAQKREAEIKAWPRIKKLALVKRVFPI